jgi:F-type H+-transporting ATPase subunit b
MIPPMVPTRLVLAALPILLAASPAWAAAEDGLDIFPDARVLALIGLFLLLVYPTHKLLLQPLMRVLDEREERILGARAKAERFAREADDVLGRYESVVGEARGRAEAERRKALESARKDQARLMSEARAEAEQELAAARDAVSRELAAAREQLRRDAEELAREAAHRVLGRALS